MSFHYHLFRIAKPGRLVPGTRLVRFPVVGPEAEWFTVAGWEVPAGSGSGFLHLLREDGRKFAVGPAAVVRAEFRRIQPRAVPAVTEAVTISQTSAGRRYWWQEDD